MKTVEKKMFTARWACDFLFSLRNLLSEYEVTSYVMLASMLNERCVQTPSLQRPDKRAWKASNLTTMITALVSAGYVRHSDAEAFISREAA